MSTSPSWFDQEKFSRLVKKVGNKALSTTVEAPPAPATAAPLPVSAPSPTGPVPIVITKPFSSTLAAPPVTITETLAALPPEPNPPIPSLNEPVSDPEPAAPEIEESVSPLATAVHEAGLDSPALDEGIGALDSEPADKKPDAPPAPPKITASGRLVTGSGKIKPGELKNAPQVPPAAVPSRNVSPSMTATAPMTASSPVNSPAKLSSTGAKPPPPLHAPRTTEISHAEHKAPSAPLSKPETRELSPASSAPRPALKSLFEYEKPAVPRNTGLIHPLTPRPSGVTPPAEIPISTAATITQAFQKITPRVTIEPEPEPPVAVEPSDQAQAVEEREEAVVAWEKVALLNEELLEVTQERDKLKEEASDLRAQAAKSGSLDDARLKQLSDDLDQARLEIIGLKGRLRDAEEAAARREAAPAPAPAANADDLAYVTEERDNIRRDYAQLREQFDIFKQEQMRAKREAMKNKGAAPAAAAPANDPQVPALKQQLSDKDNELAALKQQISGKEKEIAALLARLEQAESGSASAASSPEKDEEIAALKIKVQALEEVNETLKQEFGPLQQQISQARDEASAAQRGLALSQKALQETRDALREATEGPSGSKSMLENLKRECSTLVQQNMLLQAQHDQLARELSAAKSKIASKG